MISRQDMTTNKPEVFRFHCHGRSAPAYNCNKPADNSGEYVRLAEYEALQAECEKLRTSLAETAGVAITMLYESHRQDTIKEFDVTELTKMVDCTKHLADANVQVEKVYRKAWNMAQGCAGADWGGVQ